MIRWLFQKCSPSLKKKASQRPDKSSSVYAAAYQTALKELLDTAIVNGDGDLFLFRRSDSIPSMLAAFKEKAERSFSNGKKNQLYQTAIQDLFHPYGRKTPENIIYVYPLGDFYKLGKLTISKEDLLAFQKEMGYEQFDPSEVFTSLYLYYLTEGKVREKSWDSSLIKKKKILFQNKNIWIIWIKVIYPGFPGTPN